jgi:type I restriction enzyme M protein
MLDSIEFESPKRNMFCNIEDLSNESSVEIFFVNRLLEVIGYKDKNIKSKESIDNVTFRTGSKSIKYKPDYVISNNNIPVLVIDAKSPTEKIDDYVEQCAHYCLLINRKTKNSVKYFVLSNGLNTALFAWNEESPILTLSFAEFYSGNKKFEEFCAILSLDNLSNKDKEVTEHVQQTIVLKKINKEDAQKLFRQCHKYIWNTEKRGPNSAFIEFVKLIFLKLYNDKKLHTNYKENSNRELEIPAEANIFSEKWIEKREKDSMTNPVNDVQFAELMRLLDDDVHTKKKKVLFDSTEKINLTAATIKGVVKKLEKVDLYGIDEDLNGRLFETFLNATMRGADLGQYFTPRSIVLLGTMIADLQISETHTDKVLDASCGTGGYLIEALTIMRNIVRNNPSYSNKQKEDLIDNLSYNCLFGIDAAKDPKLARIARINMYLHGDGGSHIYLGDGLDKQLRIDKSDSQEIQFEAKEMAEFFKPNSFNVVLTNPPFSMWYEAKNESQKHILQDYELIKIDETTNQKRNRLRGSAMFIERYYELLEPGGKLISVIDETVLSSDDYTYVRDFIRDKFIIKAIISLHGDAFQQSKARVKTALVYLVKKTDKNEQQPAAFMYSSVYLGVDDLPITTKPSKVEQARKDATQEIEDICILFNKFKKGETGKWLVPAERLTGRLDVKSCIPEQGRYIDKWKSEGYEVADLQELCEPREELIMPKKDFPDDEFKILTIKYSGYCSAEEIRTGEEINFSKMNIVRTGDLVFSCLNAFHGAIGYITDEFDGCLASGSYIVVRCNDLEDSLYLWSILRTTEIRADILTSAVGMGRQTIDWNDIKTVSVPLIPKNERKKIADRILSAWEQEKRAKESIENLKFVLDKEFGVEGVESQKRFLAAKPPK